MNWDRIEGNWKQLKGRIKEKWGELTDDKEALFAGRMDQLAGVVQEHVGRRLEKAEKEADEFVADSNETVRGDPRG